MENFTKSFIVYTIILLNIKKDIKNILKVKTLKLVTFLVIEQ